MKKHPNDAGNVMNSYTQSQMYFENLGAREASEQEMMYHLRQIHRLLFMMNEKLTVKDDNSRNK